MPRSVAIDHDCVPSRTCEGLRSPACSARDDHFVEIVFGEEKLAAIEALEGLLDAAVVERAANRNRRALLHVDRIRLADVIAAVRRVLAGLFVVEERQHL